MFKPLNIDSYVGQEQIKKNLKVIITAQKYKSVYEAPTDHILLSGPAGLGKTTLAEILSRELHRPLVKIMGPHLTDTEQLDLIKIPGTFLFIDEIHAIPTKVEECLYEMMDEFKLKGESLLPFTLIGATTKEGLLSKPLRSRFTIVERLQAYTVSELCKVVEQSSQTLGLTIDDKAVTMIASRSRETPRVANLLLKRLSYYGRDITPEIAQNALDNLGVDEKGLEHLDRVILRTIRDSFNKGPVGIKPIAQIVGEDEATIESREYYLSRIGLLQRTGRGRVLTSEGDKYLGAL